MTEPKIKILIVEDHELTRLALKTSLKQSDCLAIVAEAENGLEAIEQCQQKHIDLVLMDVSMPKMDGIQASQEISKLNPNIKIIMLTQYDNDSDIMASLAAGATGYCLKDIATDRLLTAIRSVYNGDIWFDSRIAEKILRNYTNPKVENANNNCDKDPDNLIEPLSVREQEVLSLIVDGLSNLEIGQKLFISLPTVKSHVRNILSKLNCSDRTQAAVQAMRRGLV